MDKNTNAIKEYFTNEDIRDQIRGMSNEDMRQLLKGLEGMPIWFAILKYAQDRIMAIQDSFLTLDPMTEATKIARYQGIITGILDLQDAVLSLKFESKAAENPKYKKEKAKDDMGGAYGVV